MIVAFRPGASRLDRVSDGLAEAGVTYDEVGGTRWATSPAGYHHVRAGTALGRGDRAWAQARAALVNWDAHKGAGLGVHPVGRPPAPGHVVLAVRRLGPLAVVIPCRVIYTVDEPTDFGFAYGTLPGHPERGEEAFHVRRDVDGFVRFDIVAFSRPAARAMALAGPGARAVQAAVTRRYLAGMRASVTGQRPS